ncbi:hypothetical protein L7F22_011433 [Adiantum nelumboides]|nr:hypothetical protein [Adiantum nelumboides]
MDDSREFEGQEETLQLEHIIRHEDKVLRNGRLHGSIDGIKSLFPIEVSRPGHIAQNCPRKKRPTDSEDKEDRKGKRPMAGLVPDMVGDKPNSDASELCRAWGKVRDQTVLMFFDPAEASLACRGHTEVVTPIIGKLRLHIQSYVDAEEFYIMPLDGCDVLLGIPSMFHVQGIMDAYNKKITVQNKERSMFLQQYSDCFSDSLPSQLSQERPEDHAIDLVPGSSPPNRPPYRVSVAQQKEIMSQVEELLEKGLIQSSSSPFCSPVLLVQKKDGSWHMCIDYRSYWGQIWDHVLHDCREGSSSSSHLDLHREPIWVVGSLGERVMVDRGSCNPIKGGGFVETEDLGGTPLVQGSVQLRRVLLAFTAGARADCIIILVHGGHKMRHLASSSSLMHDPTRLRHWLHQHISHAFLSQFWDSILQFQGFFSLFSDSMADKGKDKLPVEESSSSTRRHRRETAAADTQFMASARTAARTARRPSMTAEEQEENDLFTAQLMSMMGTFEQLAKNSRMQKLLKTKDYRTDSQAETSQQATSRQRQVTEPVERVPTVVTGPVQHVTQAQDPARNGHRSNEQSTHPTIPMHTSSPGYFGGGMLFATTIDTLTQRDSDSMLAAMFSGRHRLCKDSKGVVFIDRDGTHFRHILNWLRIGVLPTLDLASYQELSREAEYYQLIGLMERVNAVLNRKDDDEEKPELTRKEILKCIQSEHVRLRGVNLSGQDLSKLHLVQADFSCARLINTFFSRANLRSANFSFAEADGSNFHNAILRECVFTKASLRGSLLAGANLQSASLQDACLVSCSFCEANLQSAHLQGADLTNANLSGANLEGANLKGATLVGANLTRANLQRVYLRDANLKDSNLEGANLEGANLQNANR